MIQDSGERTAYDTGAVRDLKEGKGRCDLMPLDVIGELLVDDFISAIHAEYYGDAFEVFIDEAFPDRYTAVLELSKHFEEGAKKYGEHNWQKGIPLQSYIDSAVRHYLKWRRGDKDEPHDRAVLWNLVCLMWTKNTYGKTE